ncbi:MAG TPA: DUF4160 domain-containing protein [Bradyrhizobium sp.]|nr:DUF4160 domain-containing protein [Bradyrhizobium sp.]
MRRAITGTSLWRDKGSCQPFYGGDHIAHFSTQTKAESRHVHVRAGDFEAKVWLHDLSIAASAGFPAHEIGAIIRHPRSSRGLLERKWHEHFGN